MTVKLVDGWIVSNQTGTLPRVSIRGNGYICVFYIYNTNFIKGIAIKLRHRSDLLGAYKQVYNWCESHGFQPSLHRMDNKTSKDVEEVIDKQNVNWHRKYPAVRSHSTRKLLASLPPCGSPYMPRSMRT